MSGERPVEIPEWAWDKACDAMNRAGWHMRSVRIECAKAILSAVEEEREACAKMVSDWGHKAAPASDGWGTKIMEPVDVRAIASAIRNRKES